MNTEDKRIKLLIVNDTDYFRKFLKTIFRHFVGLDDKLEIEMDAAPLHMTSDRGELFLGFCPIRTIFEYHLNLGKRLKRPGQK